MNKVFSVVLRHWPILWITNALILGGVIAFKLLTFSESWAADTQLVLPNASSNLTANLGTLGSLENEDPRFSTQINPLRLQETILESDALMELVWAEDPERENFGSLAGYKGLFRITIAEQSPVIRISTRGSTPEIAQARLTNLIKLYQQRLNQLRQANSSVRGGFSQEKLSEAQSNLERTQAELAQFQLASGLINPDEQTKSLITTIDNLQEDYVRIQADAEANADQVGVLVDRLDLTPELAIQAIGLDQNQGYTQVRQELTEVSIEIAENSVRFTPTHPQMQQLSRRYNRLNDELQRYVSEAGVNLPDINTTVTSGAEGRTELIQQMLLAESIALSRQEQANRIAAEVESLQEKFELIPDAAAQLSELQRNYDVAEGVYKGLVAQVEQSNLDAFNAYPNVQILDPPKVDPNPSSPNLRLALLNALLAAAVTSLALIILLERRNPLITPDDLKEQSFVFVSTLPWAQSSDIKTSLGKMTHLSEFNLLASNCLSFLENDQMLMVTSAEPGEGKTFVSLGLAQALNALGFRVLIADTSVEANLMDMFQHASPQPVKDLGLIHREVNADLGIAALANSSAAEFKLFTKGEYKAELERIKAAHCYDYILIDTSAIAITSVSLLMSQFFHRVLFVIKPNSSKRNPVLNVLKNLSQNSANRIGLVINGETEQSDLKSAI